MNLPPDNLRERLARIFFGGFGSAMKPKLHLAGRDQVQEFATREERNERYRILKERGTPGLCKFTSSVDGKGRLVEPFRYYRMQRRWIAYTVVPKLMMLRKKYEAGHMVWYVAWGS